MWASASELLCSRRRPSESGKKGTAMSKAPGSFEDFKRQRELEKLRKQGRGEEASAEETAADTPPAEHVRRRRSKTRELELRSRYGL
jgi:hypothetical protein